MNGNLFNGLRALHQQLEDCNCIDGNRECAECTAVTDALLVLEKTPSLRDMSERISERLLRREVASTARRGA